MVDLVANGKADVVVASPYHPQGRVEGVSFWKLALSRWCSALYRMLLPISLYTYTSIFRVYRGSFVRRAQFRSSGLQASVEILISAARLGYRVLEMPLTLRRGTSGGAKRPLLRTISLHLKLMMQCAFVSKSSDRPRHESSSGERDKRTDAMGALVVLAQNSRVPSAE
jgi:dolichol-phosphate mannosyltransferase